MTTTHPTSPAGPSSASTSTPNGELSHVKRFKPYFPPEQVEQLSAKQRGKLSVSREEKSRQQACGFIDAVGVRCGFPRRTIATSQLLYMRFHLFFPYKDFNYMEVALSTLYVSSKIHDTLKKPRDVIVSSYSIRFPQLIKKGVLDTNAIDGAMLESERKRVLGIERLILETMSFKFQTGVGFGVVLKIGKDLRASKDLCRFAWQVAVDCYRSPVPLSFPPHVIALASLYTASILLLESVHPGVNISQDPPTEAAAEIESTKERSTSQLIELLRRSGDWESKYHTSWEQVDDASHFLLDLYITILSIVPSDGTSSSPSPISPKDASAQHGPLNQPLAGLSTLAPAYKLSSFWTPKTLTELKIFLRDRRPGTLPNAWTGDTEGSELDKAIEGMGRNEGTVRFTWDYTGQV